MYYLEEQIPTSYDRRFSKFAGPDCEGEPYEVVSHYNQNDLGRCWGCTADGALAQMKCKGYGPTLQCYKCEPQYVFPKNCTRSGTVSYLYTC
jgi:hypothetical protein